MLVFGNVSHCPIQRACVILVRVKKQTRVTQIFGLGVVLASLLLLYVTTLQTIPNGSSHSFMIDVGETQIVLNEWGTLHATGYPLYVMTGAALTDLFVALDVDAVTAPALVSLLWGLLAACVFYALALHLTGRIIPAVAVIILLGMARTIWIHNVVAEIYTFGLLLLAILLALALWQREIPHLTTYPARIYWLALIGGIAVAHHRGFVVAIPALVYAVWPGFIANRATLPRVVGVSLLFGLLGFLPYLYLPLREMAGADWVYGSPDTLRGFLDQFLGTEASRFIGLRATLDALRVNFNTVTDVIVTDATLPGLVLGIAGLLFAVNNDRLWRAANTLLLSAGAAYLFHVFFYVDTLSVTLYALIIPVTVSIAFGWLLLIDLVLSDRYAHLAPIFEARYAIPLGVAPATLLLGAALYDLNHTFILDLVRDETGLETIELLQDVPEDSTVMIAWGPRHFAAGFARDVQGDLQQIDALVDHTADFRAILDSESRLVTPQYTFFLQPVDWWEARAGSPVYLHAIAPELVEITTAPQMSGDFVADVTADEIAVDYTLICEIERYVLEVIWLAQEPVSRDTSVFVHLLDETGAIIEQDDRSAPVYGWRPVTDFVPGERVRDFYTLPRTDNAAGLRFGLFYQDENGAFVNDPEIEVELVCDD